MRRLLNTLFILSEDLYLSLENENLVAWREKNVVQRIPLLNVENIFYFGYKGASPALLGACAKRQIGFCFLTSYGKFLARVCGASHGNVLLRKAQYRMAEQEADSLQLAKWFLTGKIWNSRLLLMRFLRDHPLSVNKKQFTEAIAFLKQSLHDLQKANNGDEIRGVEGNAAHLYFSLFDQLILREKKTFYLHSRNKRPPLDAMNALLSFLYTLLASDCANALETVGLDSYVGFLHRDRPGRESLALDLMEEFRSLLADRLALFLVNNQSLTGKHFKKTETGAVHLNEAGRKIVLTKWQERKQDIVEHPFLKEKMPWGLAPYVQALLLAKWIRGDLDGYPAFMGK
ncbi:type I-C CRISPR-associated endonuclease Cas1c [Acidaminococcus timonensis]|uniref:type I-C CRISPR-associated endonuclease Cas1c n=1 Tax=Acidaminococcus timonensis TaxID=1871002 RepID=UPI00248BF658|nr:type I-C CRISPR-associated endonuclease Cas1c [Acidaminococcus timonensis]